MRRTACFLAMATLALAACEVRNFTGSSPLGDEQAVQIKGRVLLADGQPYASGALTLGRQRGPKSFSTGADGGFTLDLKGYETKNGFGEAEFMTLGATRITGEQFLYRFQARQPAIELPAFTFWDGWTAPAEGTVSGEELALAWTPPAGATSYNVAITGAGKAAWDAAAAGPALRIPKAVFDNGVAYKAQVFAQAGDLQLWSSWRGFVGAPDATAKLIPIREVADDQGKTYPGLHDADLTAVAFTNTSGATPAPRASGNPLALIVDLGEEKAIARVIGYSFPASVTTIQVANDPASFGPAGTPVAAGRYFEVPLTGARGRYVRLNSPNGAFFSHGAELRIVAP